MQGIGISILCNNIIKWLLCNNVIDIKYCSLCHDCILMQYNQHPNFHYISLQKNDISIGIDKIRDISNVIYFSTSQKELKIVFINNSEFLTIQAQNALLKILEEPPNNTYFFLKCYNIYNLLTTIRSRCISWFIPPPAYKKSIKWLYTIGNTNLIHSTIALRTCNGSPLVAKKILHSIQWSKRSHIFMLLLKSIDSNNFIELLPLLNSSDKIEILYLLSIFMDTIKYHNKIKNFITNIDQKNLILYLSNKYSNILLYNHWKKWLYYMYQCNIISGINRKFILTTYLINWDIEYHSLCSLFPYNE